MPDKGQDGFLSGRIMTFRRKAEAEAGLHGVVQNMHGLYQILFNIVVFLCKKIGKDEHETIQAYADDFISYLSDFKDNNTNVDELNSFTSDEISKLWAFDVLAQMPNSRPDVGLHKDDIGKLTELFTNINANISNNAVIPELSTIDKPSFVKCYNPALKLINKEILAAGGDQKLYDLVEVLFSRYPLTTF